MRVDFMVVAVLASRFLGLLVFNSDRLFSFMENSESNDMHFNNRLHLKSTKTIYCPQSLI